MLDEINTAESLLKDIWVTATDQWRVTTKWQRLIPKLQAHMGDLSQSPLAGDHLCAVIALNRHLASIVDRRPRTRRIVGHCPYCGREITAAKGEDIRRCECGNVVDIRRIRETTRMEVDRYHKTSRLPAARNGSTTNTDTRSAANRCRTGSTAASCPARGRSPTDIGSSTSARC